MTSLQTGEAVQSHRPQADEHCDLVCQNEPKETEKTLTDVKEKHKSELRKFRDEVIGKI